MIATLPTAADYQAIFDAERVKEYPAVDAFEQRMGYAIDRAKLEEAARVLACPLKAHAPNWQHGRVIYAAVRNYLDTMTENDLFRCLDIGTAKGFSALCMAEAIDAFGEWESIITSVDVIDPNARVRRNTVAECNGYLTLRETLEPWARQTAGIVFLCTTGERAIKELDRVHFAFIDGKHSFEAVSTEASLLAGRQRPGDLAIFDDVQIDGVAKAVKQAAKHYEIEYLAPNRDRCYAIGVRRG